MNMNTTDKVQAGDSTTGTSTSTTYTIDSRPQAERGWECPRCGRINAPWKSQCDCGGNYWYPSWERPYYDEWWKHVTCAPETTWKAPSSICSSDSATSVKSNPNSTIYTTAHNPVVGGSDYWDNMSQTWSNIPNVSNNVTKEDSPWNKYFTLTSDKINKLQTQINSLKETK